MKKITIAWLLLAALLAFSLVGCGSRSNDATEKDTMNVTKINVTVSDKTFTATLQKNKATEELVAMLQKAPLTLELSDYSGFEKVGDLGASLTTSNKQTTTKAGDIVLYNGNQIVIFYGSNSWSYTRLAHVDNLDGWEEALGSGDVTVTLAVGDEL